MDNIFENTKDKKPPQPVNDSVMVRESWKLFQIVAEFVEGFERLVSIRPAVCIFGSARLPLDHPDCHVAYRLGKLLSDHGISVMTGAGGGIMESANKGAYEGKAQSIGLHIDFNQYENPNRYQNISIKFRHFFTRKVVFFKHASAYVIFPGGFGTLDELAEILVLTQLGKTKKIPIILVNKKFWDPLLSWIKDFMFAEKMIAEHDLHLFKVLEEPELILKEIQHYLYQKEDTST